MLREVAWKAGQCVGEFDGLPDRRICRIESGLADVIVGQFVAGAPYRLGERRGDILGQAQNLADFADGAARTVMHDGRADRGAMVAVAFVNVLNHLFAPLVFEIDVDIGRLVAVRRNEAGEQEPALVRIDLGDAEAKAHRAVGRRAAALAKNVFYFARVSNDVVHGEEIAGVVELGDQRQFRVELFLDFRRNAIGKLILGITFDGAGPGQIFEMLLRRLARRHRFVGIFVFQLAEREGAGICDSDSAGNGVGEILEQPCHFVRGFKMPLGIDGEPEAGLGQRAFLADAGDDVAERPALRRVIMHVVDGDERRIVPLAKLGQQTEPARLVAAMVMRAGEERAAGRCASQSREALGE